MTTIKEYDDLQIPVWALGHLVNTDHLDADDQRQVDRFMKPILKEAEKLGCQVIFGVNDPSQEPYVSSVPAFGEDCHVVDCTIKLVR